MATAGGRRRSFAPLDAGRFEAGRNAAGSDLAEDLANQGATRLSRDGRVSAAVRQPKNDAAESLPRFSQGAQPNHNRPGQPNSVFAVRSNFLPG